MGAGLATLEALDEEGLIENSARQGERFLAGLERLKEKYEMVRDVRGKGLMVGIEFGPPKSTKLKVGWNMLETVQEGLFAQLIVIGLMRNHRLLTQVSGHRVNIIKFLPPLLIGEEEVDYALDSLEHVLAEAHRFPGGIWKMRKELVKGALSH